MALTDKLRAIADAIRVKTGKSGPLTLDQMVYEIEGIKIGGYNERILEVESVVNLAASVSVTVVDHVG